MNRTDDELLADVDGHEADCNGVEADMVDSMMKQRAASRPLTERQRAWLERLLDTLDGRV